MVVVVVSIYRRSWCAHSSGKPSSLIGSLCKRDEPEELPYHNGMGILSENCQPACAEAAAFDTEIDALALGVLPLRVIAPPSPTPSATTILSLLEAEWEEKGVTSDM